MSATSQNRPAAGNLADGEISCPKVGLIIETSFASGRNILRGITRYARNHGPWLFRHEWRNTDSFFPGWLEQWRGEGLIARVESERIADAICRSGVPAVDVLGAFPGHGIPLVRVDDEAIGRVAAEHFLERGFRRFGFCGYLAPRWSTRRRDAFVQTVRNEGYPCRVYEWSDYHHVDWSWEKELDLLRDWLRELPRPAGVMACNDLLASHLLQTCRGAGIAVPDEVAVIGVDNDEAVCEVTAPPLSSVVPDDERVGYEAAGLLDLLMRGSRRKGPPVHIPPRGVCTRLSTDVLAVEEPCVAAAVRFIREHARRGIRVDDVVRAAGVSRTLLQRRFRAALGRSIHDEILGARLAHARFLLEEGDMPLSLVAEKAGFRHQEYMSAVFKKKTGQTPLQYRRARQTRS